MWPFRETTAREGKHEIYWKSKNKRQWDAIAKKTTQWHS